MLLFAALADAAPLEFGGCLDQLRDEAAAHGVAARTF